MKRFFILLFLLFFITSKVEARSGCCSHHSGVCGCGCCDGTSLSTTCLPYYPQCMSGNTQNTVQEVQVYEPTAIPTLIPTKIPTRVPTEIPTPIPTNIPTETPTPTLTPTKQITPTKKISKKITPKPTKKQSKSATKDTKKTKTFSFFNFNFFDLFK